MSDLLQCYRVKASLEKTDPQFHTHARMGIIGTFINGPQISFRSPLGAWVESALLGNLMERAAVAMDTPERYVASFSPAEAEVLLEQLHAAAAGEGVESDPEFVDEMINAVEAVIDTDEMLWIGI